MVPSTLTLETLQRQREQADEFRRAWRNGESPNAVEAIEKLGGECLHKSIAVELAYEEYCLQHQAGSPLEPTRFVQRFPRLQRSLRRQIGIHHFLSQREVNVALPDWPEAGDEISGFLLQEELGRGAFGRVFLARELKLRERVVVVKVSREGLREAQLLATVSHPGIVPIYSASVDAEWGLTTICMPFNSRATLLDVLEHVGDTSGGSCTGATIREAVAARNCSDDPLVTVTAGSVAKSTSFREAVIQFARLLADSLAFAHAKGIQHRDLKPSNILINNEGQPLLIDFNLSTEAASDDLVGGTLPYMSPEQLLTLLAVTSHGERSRPLIDERSDIYSLGVCLFELWFGHHPLGELPDLHQQGLAEYLLSQQEAGTVSVLPREDPRDEALGNLILSCLSYYADERPRSAQNLLVQLDEIRRIKLDQGSPLPRRQSSWAALTGVVCLAGGGALLAIGNVNEPVEAKLFSPTELGMAFLQSRQFGEADNALTESLRLSGQSPEVLNYRGRARLELGRYKEAFADFSQAYQMQPSNDSAAFAAYAALELRQYRTAADWYAVIVDNNPQSLSVRHNYGYALMQLEQYDAAYKHLSAAVDIQPAYDMVRLHRAIAGYHLAKANGSPFTQTTIDDALQISSSIHDRTTALQLAEIVASVAQLSYDNLRKPTSLLRVYVRLGGKLDEVRERPDFQRWVSEQEWEHLAKVQPLERVYSISPPLVLPW